MSVKTKKEPVSKESTEKKVTIRPNKKLRVREQIELVLLFMLKRQRYGLNTYRVEMLALVTCYYQNFHHGVTASTFNDHFGDSGKALSVIQARLKWLVKKEWLEFEKIGKWHYYLPTKKTLAFFTTDAPAVDITNRKPAKSA